MRTLKPTFRGLWLVCLLLYACSTSPEVYLEMGKQKLQEENFVEGISLFEEALKGNPSFHEAWNAKGVASFQLNKNTDALNAFNKAIELNNTDYRYFYNRGNVQRRLNAPEKAIEDYSKAIELDNSHYEIFLNRALSYASAKQLPTALADFDKAVALNQTKDTAVLLYRGKALLRAFEFEKAAADFKQLALQEKNNAEVWYQLGLAYQGLKNKEEACKAVQQAEKLGYPQAKAFLEFYCKN